MSRVPRLTRSIALAFGALAAAASLHVPAASAKAAGPLVRPEPHVVAAVTPWSAVAPILAPVSSRLDVAVPAVAGRPQPAPDSGYETALAFGLLAAFALLGVLLAVTLLPDWAELG